jgi:hypothetical protein
VRSSHQVGRLRQSDVLSSPIDSSDQISRRRGRDCPARRGEARSPRHAASTFSTIVGSSSPTPVRFTRRDTGYCRSALSAAGAQHVHAERAVQPRIEVFLPQQYGASGHGTVSSNRMRPRRSRCRTAFLLSTPDRSSHPRGRAKAKIGEPSAAVNRCGCLPSASSIHSKKPPAGMMQRRR